jgi:hypothetical protein
MYLCSSFSPTTRAGINAAKEANKSHDDQVGLIWGLVLRVNISKYIREQTVFGHGVEHA